MTITKSNLDILFKTAVNTPAYQLISHAQTNAAIVYESLMNESGSKMPEETLLAIIGTFVAADNELSSSEVEFIRNVFEADFDEDVLFHYAKMGADSDIVDKVDRMIDRAPENVKEAFMKLCLDVIASDGTITPSEKLLFLKYLA